MARMSLNSTLKKVPFHIRPAIINVKTSQEMSRENRCCDSPGGSSKFSDLYSRRRKLGYRFKAQGKTTAYGAVGRRQMRAAVLNTMCESDSDCGEPEILDR
jgi:hypothetical protein